MSRNDLLDHAVDLFPAPDRALGRLQRRHQRRQRNRRLAAGGVGLAIAIALVATAAVVDRSSDSTPVQPPPSPEPTGPAVASFEVFRDPMAIATGHGAVWVARLPTTLMRFDPASGELTASIHLGGDGVGGLAPSRSRSRRTASG